MKCKNCNSEVAPNAQFNLKCSGKQSNLRKWILTVVGVLLIGLIGGVNYGCGASTSQMSAVDNDSLQNDLTTLLTAVVAPSVELDQMGNYFTEGFVNVYREKCENAEREGCEYPRLWWQESETDPESFNIQEISTKSDDEAVANVIVIGEAPDGKIGVLYEVTLKRENGKWLIDAIKELQEVTLDGEENQEVGNGNQDAAGAGFVGKVYKGSGNGGGMYTEMTITFNDERQCTCVSDWYQAYPSPKTIKGTYSVKGNLLTVICKDNDTEFKFEFEVEEDGRVIEFDHSDPDMEGTIGRDFMSLEKQ